MVSPVGQRVSFDNANTWRFDILVPDEFVASELGVIVDVLNISNRVNVRPIFEWTFVSAAGGITRSRTRVMVETETVSAKPNADYLFVVGSSNPDYPNVQLGKIVSAYTNRDAQVFLLAEAASRYIRGHGAEWRKHTTHWENTMLLRERQGVFETNSSIAVEDGPIVTCAGMSTTLDVILAVVGRHMSAAAKRTVADILLHETIRDFSTNKPNSGVPPRPLGTASWIIASTLCRPILKNPCRSTRSVPFSAFPIARWSASSAPSLGPRPTLFIANYGWHRPTTCF